MIGHLTFSDQISSLSKTCWSHTHELPLHPSLILKQPVPSLPLLSTLNLTTVTLSTTIFLNLKFNRLQLIQNCLASTVVKAPKSSLVTPILRSLHWLKINERIEYKLLSLMYKVITTSQPDYTQSDLSSVYM